MQEWISRLYNYIKIIRIHLISQKIQNFIKKLNTSILSIILLENTRLKKPWIFITLPV